MIEYRTFCGGEIMLVIIVIKQIIVSFFLLIIGAFCYKKDILSAGEGKSISNFILTFVSPALILDACQITYSEELFHNLLWAFGMSGVSFVVAIAAAQVLISKRKISYNIERFSLVYTNCGFIGVPLVQALYGDEGVLYMTSYIAMFNILLWTHGVVCMSERMDKKQIVSILKCPTIYAIVIGIFSFCMKITYPEVFGTTIAYVADLNTPLAMIVAGISVMQSDFLGAMRRRRIYVVSFLKLLAIPVMAMLAMSLFPCPAIIQVIIVLATGCPVGASVIMFALRYGKDEIYGAELFAVTTIFSLVTMPVLIALCTI